MTPAHCAGLLRIIITPFTFIYLTDYKFKRELLLILVIMAIISDILDGYFSRKHNTVSNFGAFLDFTADKIFVCTTLVLLSSEGEIPLWITLIIINREFWIMGIRIFSENEGFTIPSKIWGKLKTITIFAAILAHLLNFTFDYTLLIIGIVLTIIPLVDYAYITVKYMRNSDKVY